MRKISSSRKATLAAILAGSIIALTSPQTTRAAGDGNDGGSGGSSCATGEVKNKKTGKCEKKEAVLDQDSLYEAGRELAYAGKYEEAISVLMLAPELDDKRILNFLGYSHRKLGRLDTGIEYYKRAMRNDPDYALVREYYGEALLQKNDVEGARVQLAEIERICGNRACEPYEDLAEEIEKFASKG